MNAADTQLNRITTDRFIQIDCPALLRRLSMMPVWKGVDQKAVIAVNPKAIVQRDGKSVVFRLAGDSVEAVSVTPGRKIGDVQEVAGALKSGERVVLNPAETLKAGAKVAVASK